MPFSDRSRARRNKGPRSAMSAAATAGLMAFAATGAAGIGGAHAEFKMRYPNIDYREIEIENNFSTTYDKDRDKNGISTAPTEIGIGVLPWLFLEVEGEFGKDPGGSWKLDATTFESYLMLTEPGKYWLDFSLFAEYSRAARQDDADSIEVGALLQKQDGKFLHTLNLFIEKEVGSNAGDEDTVSYSWQTRYMWNQYFQPGIEFFGEIEDIRHPGSFDEQQFRIGPMFGGSYNLGEVGGMGKIKYEAGYLFGVTDATEDRTLVTRVEYEIPF